MELVNLTPHDVVLFSTEGDEVIATIPASGTVARVAVEHRISESVVFDGFSVDIVNTEYGRVANLPDEDGPTYIVSSIVLMAIGDTRSDVVAPDTSSVSVVRDNEGRIVGVRRFTRSVIDTQEEERV